MNTAGPAFAGVLDRAADPGQAGAARTRPRPGPAAAAPAAPPAASHRFTAARPPAAASAAAARTRRPGRTARPTAGRACRNWTSRAVRGRWFTGTETTRPPARMNKAGRIAVHVVEVRQFEERLRAGTASARSRYRASRRAAARRGPELASRDDSRLVQLSRRRVRCPAISSGPAARRRRVGLRLGEQRRDVGRVVLAVAVQRRDPLRPRRPHPGDDRGTLAAAGPVPPHHQRRPLAAARSSVASVLPSST